MYAQGVVNIEAIQTRILVPPKDDLLSVLGDVLPPELPEKSVMIVASKVVSIWQGRCVPIPEDASEAERLKQTLIKEASEYYLLSRGGAQFPRTWTIAEGTLVGSAGIDRSNGDDHFILWPEHPDVAAEALLAHIKHVRPVTNMGVVIVDSNSTPLRNGTVGTALGYAGFVPVRDYRGTPDLFDRTFLSERLNIAETLASAATLVIGEGSESTPLAIATDLPDIDFDDSRTKGAFLSHRVSLKEDVFAPLLNVHPWQQHD